MASERRRVVRATSTLRRALALASLAGGIASCSAGDIGNETSARQRAELQGGPSVQPQSVNTWFGARCGDIPAQLISRRSSRSCATPGSSSSSLAAKPR